ncbi:MAG: hypothetical protein IK085_03650 [Clostridia bacterium]|nr:hypothetical protein [Clostridia bacterium]
MKTSKRLLSLLLSVFLLFGTVALGGTLASAEGTYSVGDTLEYGTYPQSGVTDEATVAALNKKLTDDGWVSYGYYSGTNDDDDGNMVPSDYMRYQDVALGGVKYRAVTFDRFRPKSTGYKTSNNQSDNGYSPVTTYWFKFEPIVWKVLDPESGFIVCNSTIDSQAYNNYLLSADGEYYGNAEKTYIANDYANSSIRAWLNNDFINTAFSSSQQENIKVTELDNSCPYDSNYDSANTSDKIFLLSYNEATNSDYGFNSDAELTDKARKRNSSDYAECQGIYENSGRNTRWWLRSPYNSSLRACLVSCFGLGSDERVNYTMIGVVPALKLQNLKSDPTGAGVSAEGTYSVGDTLEYGTYPQSGVTNEATVAALNAALMDDGWVSYGYYSGTDTWDDGLMRPGDWMRYQDVALGRVKYRAVTFDRFRPEATGYTSSSNKQSENGYSTGTTYWFKFEPIVWKVLDPDSGLIVCNSVIDSQAYNNYILYANREYWGNAEKTYRANDYANSSIRAWLNNDFINTAFSSSQQENIRVTELDNSCPYDSNYDSANTSDKIFLLSYNEVTNSAYGFNSDADSSDTARKRTSSDYAKCQGIGKNSAGNSHWWLRSPNLDSYRACYVIYDGYASHNNIVNRTYEGVVPALKLHFLESDPTGVPVTVEHVIPLLRINEETNFWEVSYDGGTTWTSLGVKATGENGQNGTNG